MEKIKHFVDELRKKKRFATISSGCLLAAGVMFTIPSWTSGSKNHETLFCYSTDNLTCRSNPVRGLTWMVAKERRNYVFDGNVKIIKDISPTSPYLPVYSAIGAACSIASYLTSRAMTITQEKAIHSEFSLLKVDAIANDIMVKSHLNLVQFSSDRQSEVTMAAIAKESSDAFNSMKSDDEVFYDRLMGMKDGEISSKIHDLRLVEIEKDITDNKLALAKSSIELDKISSKSSNVKDTHISSPDLKEELISALKSHEDGYLWNIIKSLKPLWLIGNQGSGKTYAASSIALVRKYCLDAPVQQLIDRHATGDNADVWKLLDARTKAESEEEISEAFDECRNRWMSRIKEKPETKQQIIVDEFTNLKSLCGDSAVNFFKMSLTDTRKAREYLLGITHNATNESFPDGTASSRKSGTILLERFSADGETPLSRVVIRYGIVDEKGNNLEDVEKTIPDWFHPHKIHGHFNGHILTF
jgi:hypothetical protein